MTKPFSGLRVAPYQFKRGSASTPTTRPVLAIYAGNRIVAFMEYDSARKFVDRVHDLADEHDRQQRNEQP